MPTDAWDYFSGAESNFQVAIPAAESAVYDCVVDTVYCRMTNYELLS